MMAEGMIDETLVITRTIHDRYHAAKRNPLMKSNATIITHGLWRAMELSLRLVV